MDVDHADGTGSSFYGRSRLLASLRRNLARVSDEGRGQMLAVRGRRQSGKSRLITQLVETSGLPYLYFTAVKNAPPAVQLNQLTDDALGAERPLPNISSLFAAPPSNWSDALGRLAVACQGQPSIVVLDEFPWATATDDTLEGMLQRVWDRQIEHSPVLWVLIGSDVAMMERLTTYDRPLFGRARNLVVAPFDPGDCALITGWDAATAFDAYLVTGGYPRLMLDCARHKNPSEFVTEQLTDENNDLAVIGQTSLDAEFPQGEQVRSVLTAIGAAEIGLSTFSEVVGRVAEPATAAQTAVTRAVKILDEEKDVISVERPVGAGEKSKLRRYRIKDSYLRFWFRFVMPQIPNIARGRSDIAIKRFERDWPTWRGTAIEPVVREALLRLAPDRDGIEAVEQVGAWWNRDGSSEYDIVAADATGRRIYAVGSIKWRTRSPFTNRDLHDLAEARQVVPRAGAAQLVAVCPAGVDDRAKPDIALSAQDLLSAWT